MKKMMLAFLTLITATAACAQRPSTSPEPELLSMQTLREGNVEVSLPTVRNPDGSICVSYLASSSLDKEGNLTTEVAQICGPASSTGEARPEQLVSMQIFKNGDLAVQLPTTQSTGQEVSKAALVNDGVSPPVFDHRANGDESRRLGHPAFLQARSMAVAERSGLATKMRAAVFTCANQGEQQCEDF